MPTRCRTTSVLGNIQLTKVDLDAARYLAAGSNGDTTLEGAVYDLYAADTIEHPDGVSGVVDYSKITDANGQPIWHTTVLTNGGWDTDYLPILQKDRLVASAKITDGKLAFANLYMGRYYLVERATGLVLPIDGNGKLYITGKYPQLNKKLERTGKYSSLATKGGRIHRLHLQKPVFCCGREPQAGRQQGMGWVLLVLRQRVSLR